MIGRLSGLRRSQAKTRAAELLGQFDLADAADRMLKEYSGGMRRRLDLAAGLVTRPPVLFLDEPTTGLDPASRVRMWNVIRELVAGGVTLLLTTQYLDEADELADRIVVIDHGHVIAEGVPAELKAQTGGARLEVTLTEANPATCSATPIPRRPSTPGPCSTRWPPRCCGPSRSWRSSPRSRPSSTAAAPPARSPGTAAATTRASSGVRSGRPTSPTSTRAGPVRSGAAGIRGPRTGERRPPGWPA